MSAAGGSGGMPPRRGAGAGSGSGSDGRGAGGEPPAKRARTGREKEARLLEDRRGTRAQAAGSARPEVRSAGGRRGTATARAAAGAARAQRVGDASRKMQEAAAEVPGSYASAALSNQGFNRHAAASASGHGRRADHAPTDWSQRGPAVERESAANSADTVRRPAFSVPTARHDAHPTTVHGHEEGGVAARERQLQLTGGSREVASGGRAATAADYEAGRVEAAKLHLRHYGRDHAWSRMSARDKAGTRASLERSLEAPTRLNDDRGRALAHVSLDEENRRRILHTYDRSVAGAFSGGYTSDSDDDIRSDAQRRRQRRADVAASSATAFGAGSAGAAAAAAPARAARPGVDRATAAATAAAAPAPRYRVARATAAAAAPAPHFGAGGTAASAAAASEPRRGSARVATAAAATATAEVRLAGSKRKRGS